MSLTQREREHLRSGAWKRNAKGKGNKWQMLRDVVVFCALVPWTTTSLEDVMYVWRGLSFRKTYEILQALERAGAVESTDIGGQVMWGATKLGVSSFIQGDLEFIPATLAQAVWTLSGVEKYGESKAP